MLILNLTAADAVSAWRWRIASKIKRTESGEEKASKRAQVKDKG
jgi:hypothetical protein